jgi:hypothetical protein
MSLIFVKHFIVRVVVLVFDFLLSCHNWLSSLHLQMETNVSGIGDPSLKRLLATEERHSLRNGMYPAFFSNEVISSSSYLVLQLESIACFS